MTEVVGAPRATSCMAFAKPPPVEALDMSRLNIALLAFIAGIAAALLALGVAFRATPGVIMADDMAGALEAAAAQPLSRFPARSVIYVKSSLGPVLLEKLAPRHPALTLRPYGERPPDNCAEHDPATPRCERDDFVKLEVLSEPIPGTLLVAVGTSRAFGQSLLVKILGQWHVLIDRSYDL